MRLSYDFYSAGGARPDVVILHGLFGRKRNWRSVAKQLSSSLDVWTVDLRSHGDSPAGELEISEMAEDLFVFLEEHGLAAPVLLGHSLGGKVAGEFLLRHPERASALILVDVSPFGIPRDVCEGLERIASAIEQTDLSAFSSRGEAQRKLAKMLGDGEIAAFILQNAERDKRRSGLQWREGTLEAARAVDRICSTTMAGRRGTSPLWSGPVLLLRGGASPHVPEGDIELVESLFPSLRMETIEGAGHWLHMSHREEVISAFLRFL